MSFTGPITLFWTLALIALIYYILKRKKTARIFLLFGILELFIFTITPLPVYLVRSLEKQYKVYNPQAPAKKLPILVLGAGHINNPDLPALQRLSIPLLGRVSEGVRLYRLSSGCPIIFSGFSRFNHSPHAITMSEAAVELGVNPKDTLMLVTPTNTWEEAAAFKKRFGTNTDFILVTSAIHMPRAMEIFKDMGMHPIAAPTNFINSVEPGANPYTWGPSSIKSIYTDLYTYEFFSTRYYRWFKKDDYKK